MPTLELPPITRTTLALFAGASGDHNPIHIDLDFARKAGMKDVFAHGMLSMAYLARALTQWVPQRRILSYGVRFAAITNLGDRVQCSGKVVLESAAGAARAGADGGQRRRSPCRRRVGSRLNEHPFGRTHEQARRQGRHRFRFRPRHGRASR